MFFCCPMPKTFGQTTFIVDDFYGHLNKKQKDSAYNTAFQARLKITNMKFKQPKKFNNYPIYLENTNVRCLDNEAQVSSFCKIVSNKDSSIIIGLTIMDTVGNYKKSKTYSRMGFNFNPEDNWKRWIIYHSDTTAFPVIYYTSEYLKMKYNADDGGQYNLKCSLPYKGQYKIYKVVFLHKKNHGHAEIIYFTKGKSEWEMDNIIKSTAGMLKYL